LPSRWDPPPASYTFANVAGNPAWSVEVEDSNSDGLPDRVRTVSGAIPRATQLTSWNGGNPPFQAQGLGGNIAAGYTLVLIYQTQGDVPGNINTLDTLFANATHVHVEATETAGLLARAADSPAAFFPAADGEDVLIEDTEILDDTWTVTVNGQSV